MSQAIHLTKDKIERLKTFLSNDDIKKCCKKFKVESPAFRESISNTVKSLHDYYVKGIEYYLGSFTSTIDITFNKEMISIWIERHNKREKPNAVDNEAIETNDGEILRGITNHFPKLSELSYRENDLRVQGARWVLENFKVTGKIKNKKIR